MINSYFERVNDRDAREPLCLPCLFFDVLLESLWLVAAAGGFYSAPPNRGHAPLMVSDQASRPHITSAKVNPK